MYLHIFTTNSTEPGSPALQADSLPSGTTREALGWSQILGPTKAYWSLGMLGLQGLGQGGGTNSLCAVLTRLPGSCAGAEGTWEEWPQADPRDPLSWCSSSLLTHRGDCFPLL